MSVPYNQHGSRHVFGPQHLVDASGRPLFELPPEEVVGGAKLLKHGYNGQEYNYFIKEIMPGYESTITRVIPDPDGTADFYFTALNEYDGFSDGRITESLILLHGFKHWDDFNDLYGFRPDMGTPGDYGVELRIYRSVTGRVNTLTDITSSVDITWFAVPGSPNVWRYEVYAKPEANQATPVGDGPGTLGSRTLYRYATPGVEYIYYVEEVAQYEGAHAYDIVRETGTRYTLTVPPADPAALAGNIAVYPLNMRLRAAADGENRVVSFRNVLRETTPDITKQWVKSDGSPMSSHELELMLPDMITFEVWYRLDRVDGAGNVLGQVEDWEPMRDPHSTANPAPVLTVTRSKSAIISALGAGNSMRIVFNTTPLPTIGDEPDIRRTYRLVETRIGSVDVNEFGYAGGFDVTYDSEFNRVVTNTLRTIPLTIRKEWDDDNGRDGYRPPTVTFLIENQNNPPQSMLVTLSANNFADLTGASKHILSA
jgi:hypothetical protein